MVKNIGFPAGTLIHTNKGSIPIQDIKVGDMVLSRPEWGGKDAPTAYKRVLLSFCSDEDELIRLACVKDSEYDDIDALVYLEFISVSQSIWEESLKKWVSASDIEIGTLLSSINNKDNLRVLSTEAVYKGYIDNDLLIGGCFKMAFGNDDAQELDMEIQFTKDGYYFVNHNKYLCSTKYHILDDQILKLNESIVEAAIDYIYSNTSNFIKLKVPVYTLEVEESYTYFVGEHAIWVHQ